MTNEQLKQDASEGPIGAVASTAGLGGWVACVDRLPDIHDDEIVSDSVLGGCWITDDWLRDDHPNKRRFVFGACCVRRADNLREFPQGKQWHTFGPSHNQITHWCEVTPPVSGNERTDEEFDALGTNCEWREEIDRLRQSVEFYKRRCDTLQEWQSKMRDPERTIVCDVLANGCTLPPDYAGDRYKVPN